MAREELPVETIRLMYDSRRRDGESSLDAAMMVLGRMGHEPLGIGLEALCELFDRFFAELGIGDAP